jgi:enoyl-CoA hydratase/carnithine racemase
VDLVLTEKRGPVGIITMNQPERLNPLSTYPGGSEDQILQALLDMEREEQIRAVILTGAGRAFCGGADRRSALSATSYTLDQRVERWVSYRGSCRRGPLSRRRCRRPQSVDQSARSRWRGSMVARPTS